MITITEEKKETACVFKLQGRLDTSTTLEVEKKLAEAIQGDVKHIILDLSQLDYISSSGIRILIRFHKELEKNKKHLFLVAIPKPIENILYITGFLPYFKIHESTAAALQVAI